MNAVLEAIPTATGYFGEAMRSEIIEDFDVLRGMSASWSHLWNASRSTSIFQSLPWLSAWWKAFGKDLALCTPVVYQGPEIVGILPLVRCGKVLRFIGTPGSDYCDILCDDTQAPQIIEAALRALYKMGGWRTCRLTNLRDDSTLFRHSEDLPRDIAKYMHIETHARRSSLSLDGDRNAVIDSVRHKPDLRRNRNKLYKTGSVRFRHLESREQMHGYLDTLFQQHIDRRVMNNEESQFLAPEWRVFYHAMVDELNPRHELRFSVLELDGRPVACHFGFEWRSSLTLYKTTFDIELQNLSPGKVLLSELFAYAGDRQLDEVDFTVGTEAYKEHFTNQARDMYCAVLYPQDWQASFRQSLQALQGRVTGWFAKRHLKRHAERILHWLHYQYQKPSASISHQRLLKSGMVYVRTPRSSQSNTTRAWPVRPAMSCDITALAMQYTQSISPRTLRIYLARLHRGDSCYLLCNDGNTCIGWVCDLTVLVNAETSEAIQHPAELLYDFRPLGDSCSSIACMALIQWFGWHAEQSGSLACIRVPRSNFAIRKALKDDGFELWTDVKSVQE